MKTVHALTSRSRRAPLLLGCVLLGFAALILTLAGLARGAAPPDPAGQLRAAWQKAQDAGSYYFEARATEELVPRTTTVYNPGRTPQRLGLTAAGAVALPDRSRVRLTTSMAGQSAPPLDMVQIGSRAWLGSGGEWREEQNPAALMAPQGDYLVWLAAARDVQELEPLIVGDRVFPHYGFTVDGPTVARLLQQRLNREMANRLPEGMRVVVPPAFAGLTGRGEVWLDGEGLPTRQFLELSFPNAGDDFSARATLVVDFHDFGAQVEIAPPGQQGSRGDEGTRRQGESRTSKTSPPLPLSPSPPLLVSKAPHFPITLLLLLVTCSLVYLLIRHRRLRYVYAAIVVAVVLSLTIQPLAQVMRVRAALGPQPVQAAPVVPPSSASGAAQEATQPITPTLPAGGPPEAPPDPAADDRVQALFDRLVQAAKANSNLPGAGDRAAIAALGAAPLIAAASAAPGGPLTEPDTDQDGLSDAYEELLGTDPHDPDTDKDLINDGLEVHGIVMTYTNGVTRTWYTNAFLADSNHDGLIDSSEWMKPDGFAPDFDRDGDGTPDVWDEDNDGDGVLDEVDLSPWSYSTASDDLTVEADPAGHSGPIYFEWQIRPVTASHLYLANRHLDWPYDDQGQIQDLDNSPDDLTLLPMLQVRSNVRPMAESQYGLSVEFDRSDWSHPYVYYVPLTVVDGGTPQAFYGKVAFDGGSVGSRRSIKTVARLVWLVQAQNDSQDDQGKVTTTTSVIKSYSEPFFATGIAITKQGGMEAALFGTPQTPEEDLDLAKILTGLEFTFAQTSTGSIADVVEIFQSPAGHTITDTFGVTRTVVSDYGSFSHVDEALASVTMTATRQLLDLNYSTTITPSLLLAYERRTGGLTLDNQGSLETTHNLHFDLGVTAALIHVDRGMRLNSYRCDVSSFTFHASRLEPLRLATSNVTRDTCAWQALDLNGIFAELERRYGHDPDVTRDDMDATQIFWLIWNRGQSQTVKVGNVEVKYPKLSQVEDFVKATVKKLAKYGPKVMHWAEFKATTRGKLSDLWETVKKHKWRTLTITAVAVVLIVAILVLKGFLKGATLIISKGVGTVMNGYKGYKVIKTLVKAGTYSEGMVEATKMLREDKALGVVGLVIELVFIWYLFSTVATNPATNGMQWWLALSFAIGQTVLAILFFVLSLTVIGFILVALYVIVSFIFQIFDIDIDAKLAAWIGSLFVQVDLRSEIKTVNVTDFDAALSPSSGPAPGSQFTVSALFNSTLGPADSGDASDVAASHVWPTPVAGFGDRGGSAAPTLGDQWCETSDRGKTKTCHDPIGGRYVPWTPEVNAPLDFGFGLGFELRYRHCVVGLFCGSDSIKDKLDPDSTTLYLDVLPGDLDGLWNWNPWSWWNLDPDGDGLTNEKERIWGTDPARPDSDYDGLSDEFEVRTWGLGTHISPVKADTDEDGMTDAEELAWDTDPTRADTDGDGLWDGGERAGWRLKFHGAYPDTWAWPNPFQADPDGDGMTDAQEYAAGTNPQAFVSNLTTQVTVLPSPLAIVAPTSYVTVSVLAMNLTTQTIRPAYSICLEERLTKQRAYVPPGQAAGVFVYSPLQGATCITDVVGTRWPIGFDRDINPGEFIKVQVNGVVSPTLADTTRITMTSIISYHMDISPTERIVNDLFSLVVDADNPDSAIVSPTPGQFVGGGAFNVAGRAHDPTSSVGRVEVSVDGGEGQVAAGAEAWTWPWQLPADGDHTLQSQAFDVFDHPESPQPPITVYVDQTAPRTTLTSPTDGAVIRVPADDSGARRLTVTGRSSDETGAPHVAGVLAADVSLSAGVWQPATLAVTDATQTDWSTSARFPSGRPNGAFNLTARARDTIGNVEQTGPSVSLTVDNLPPGVTDAGVSGSPTGLVVNGRADDTGLYPPAPTPVPLQGTVSVEQASLHITPAEAGERAGEAIAVGDLNGDGQGDFAVGAPGSADGAGRVYVFLGRPGGWPPQQHHVGATPAVAQPPAHVGATRAVAQSPAHVGATLAVAQSPAHVGATLAVAQPPGQGQALPLHAADAAFLGPPNGELGAWLAGVGDVDGDGYDDLLAGARAGAYLLHGQDRGWRRDLPADPSTGLFLDRVVLAGAGAGDADGDGRADVALIVQNAAEAAQALLLPAGRPERAIALGDPLPAPQPVWTHWGSAQGIGQGNGHVARDEERHVTWFATADHLYRIDDRGTPTDTDDDIVTDVGYGGATVQVGGLVVAADHALWMTNGEVGGNLRRLDDHGTPDPSDDTWTVYDAYPHDLPPRSYMLAQTRDGGLWMTGNWLGVPLFRFDDNGTPLDQSDDHWTGWRTYEGHASSLCPDGSGITALTPAPDGALWAGFGGNPNTCVSRIDVRGTPTDVSDDVFTNIGGLEANYSDVAWIREDPPGTLWYYWYQGFYPYACRRDLRGTPTDLSDDLVRCEEGDKAGQLAGVRPPSADPEQWGSDGDGLWRLGPDPRASGASIAGAGDVNGDGLADVLVGDPASGEARLFLGRQDTMGTAWTPDAHYRDLIVRDELNCDGNYFTSHITRDSQGRVWVAGCERLARRWPDGRWTSFRTDDGLASNNTNQVALEPGGAVWVSSNSLRSGPTYTKGGLSRLDDRGTREEADDVWTTWTDADYAEFESTNGVIVDRRGTVWVAAIYALVRINLNGTPTDKLDDVVTFYNSSNSPLEEGSSPGSLVLDPWGAVFLRTYHNLYRLDDRGTDARGDDIWTMWPSLGDVRISLEPEGVAWLTRLDEVIRLDLRGTPANPRDDVTTSWHRPEDMDLNQPTRAAVEPGGRIVWIGEGGGWGLFRLDTNGTPMDKSDDTWNQYFSHPTHYIRDVALTRTGLDMVLGGFVRFWQSDTSEGTGLGAAGLGDVNGDGLADFAVGQPHYGAAGEGRVQLFLGSVSPGVRAMPGGVPELTPAATLVGSSGDQAGTTIAPAGDVNHDGLADFLIGTQAGKTYLVHGRSSWPSDVTLPVDATITGATSAIGTDTNCDGSAEVFAATAEKAQAAVGGPFGCAQDRQRSAVVYVDDDYCPTCSNDGHTWGVDAFASIQAAVDAAPQGGTAHVGPGVYHEHLTIGPKSVSVIGAGADEVILDGDEAGQDVVTFDGAVGSMFAGFTVTGSGKGDFVTGIKVKSGSRQVLITRCIIRGNWDGVGFNGGHGEVKFSTLVGNAVAAVWAAGGGTEARAYDNLVVSNGGTAFKNFDTTFHHDYNGFFDNAGGDYYGTSQASHEFNADPLFVDPAQHDYRLQPGSPAIDAANPHEPTPAGGGAHADMGYAEYTTGPARGTVYVDDDYCATCDNDGHAWGEDAFDRVQDAINATAPGGTVLVAPGHYREQVTLADSVTVRGAGPDVTTLDAGGLGPAVRAMTVTQASLIGFTLTGSRDESWQACIEVWGPSRVRVERNLLRCREGVNVRGNSRNATVLNNTLVAAYPGKGAGFYVASEARGVLLMNNIVTGFLVGLHDNEGSGLTHAYNLYWGNADDYWNASAGRGEFNANPLFVDPADGDYRLQIGSPAIGVGRPFGLLPDQAPGVPDGALVSLGYDEGPREGQPLGLFFNQVGTTCALAQTGVSRVEVGLSAVTDPAQPLTATLPTEWVTLNNPSPAAPFDWSTTFPQPDLEGRPVRLYARAYDTLGNVSGDPAAPTAQDAVAWLVAETTYDTIPPVVTLLAPAAGVTLTAGSTYLAATASDSASGVASVAFVVDSVTYQGRYDAGSGRWVAFARLADGTHSVTATARDPLENAATTPAASFSVQVVGGAPAIEAPPPDTYVGSSVAVAGYVPGGGVADEVTFSADGTEVGEADVQADGTFSKTVSLGLPDGPITLTAQLKERLTFSPVVNDIGTFARGDRAVTLQGDWDGDGKQDIAGWNATFNNGQGGWDMRLSAGVVEDSLNFSKVSNDLGSYGGGHSSRILVGDWDGDGRSDVALWTAYNKNLDTRLSRGLSDGTLHFEAIANNWGSWPDGLSNVRVGDFNGDGVSDMVERLSSGGNSYIFITWRSGSMLQGQVKRTNMGALAGGDATRVILDDFDGDGKTDVGAWNGSGWDFWVDGTVSGTVINFTRVGNDIGGFAGGNSGIMWVDDLNGDGKTDIAGWNATFNNGQGGWDIRLSQGLTGNSLHFKYVPNNLGSFANPYSAGRWIADFTGDGRAEAAQWPSGANSWDFRLNDGVVVGPPRGVRVTLDSTAPALNVTQPAAGVVISSTTVIIAGTTSDGGSGLAEVQYSVDGAAWTPLSLDASGAFSGTWAVPTADWVDFTLQVRAVDNVGNATTTQRTVTVDNVAPGGVAPFDFSVAPGSYLQAGTVLTVTWASPIDGSGQVTILAATDRVSNTVPTDVPTGPGFAHVATLDGAGDWYFHLLVRDAAGNALVRHAGPWHVGQTPGLGLVPPGAAWRAPVIVDGVIDVANGEWDPALHWLGDDARGGDDLHLYAQWDETALYLAAESAWWDVEGIFYAYLDTKPGGTWQTADGDTQYAVRNTQYAIPDLPFDADYLFVIDGAGQAELRRWDGSAWVPAGFSGAWAMSSLGEVEVALPWPDLQPSGPVGLFAVAYVEPRLLAVRNLQSAVWAVFPATNPLNGPWTEAYRWESLGADVTPNAGQPLGSLVELEVTSQPSPMMPLGDGAVITYRVSVSNLGSRGVDAATLQVQASHGLGVIAHQGAGRCSACPEREHEWTLELWQGIPAGATRHVTITAQVQAEAGVTETVSTAFVLTAQQPGSAPVVSTKTLHHQVDFIGPEVRFLNPADGGTVRPGPFTVTGVADPGGGISIGRVEFSTDDGATWQVARGTAVWTAEASAPDDGTITLWARAFDRAGNGGPVAQVTAVVDSVPPAAIITAPADGALLTGATVVIRGTARDAFPEGGALRGVEVAVDDGEWILADGPFGADGMWAWTWYLPAEDGVTHTLRSRATDAAGNVGQPSAPVMVVVDTVAPTSTIAYPADGAWLEPGTTQIVIWGWSEDGSGVASVQVSLDGGLTWADAVLADEARALLEQLLPAEQQSSAEGALRSAVGGRRSLWAFAGTLPAEDTSPLILARGTDTAGNVELPGASARLHREVMRLWFPLVMKGGQVPVVPAPAAVPPTATPTLTATVVTPWPTPGPTETPVPPATRVATPPTPEPTETPVPQATGVATPPTPELTETPESLVPEVTASPTLVPAETPLADSHG